jgi:hypothetical protein
MPPRPAKAGVFILHDYDDEQAEDDGQRRGKKNPSPGATGFSRDQSSKWQKLDREVVGRK